MRLTQFPSLFNERREPRVAVLALLFLVGAGSLGCSDPATPSGGGGAAGLGGGASSGGAGRSSAGASGGGGAGANGPGGVAGSGGAGVAGANGVAGSGGAGGGATIDASFDTLKNLIPTHCFGGLCHDLPENPLHLTVDDKLYATLGTHTTKHCGPLLVPGSPQNSALVKLLKGPCGETDRMPFGKCFEDEDEGCVAPAEIAAIEQWIAKGAPQ